MFSNKQETVSEVQCVLIDKKKEDNPNFHDIASVCAHEFYSAQRNGGLFLHKIHFRIMDAQDDAS